MKTTTNWLVRIAVLLLIPILFAPFAALAQAFYIGNSLSVSNGAADNGSPLVILGEYDPSGPLSNSPIVLSNGTVEDVTFYGKNYNFTLYALSYAGSGSQSNEQNFQVVASQSFSNSAVPSPRTNTLSVSNFSVYAGNFLAFCGQGPYYPQNSNDTSNSDATYEDSTNANSSIATPPGGHGSLFTVGSHSDTNSTYDLISDSNHNQGRRYAFAAHVVISDDALGDVYDPVGTTNTELVNVFTNGTATVQVGPLYPTNCDCGPVCLQFGYYPSNVFCFTNTTNINIPVPPNSSIPVIVLDCPSNCAFAASALTNFVNPSASNSPPVSITLLCPPTNRPILFIRQIITQANNESIITLSNGLPTYTYEVDFTNKLLSAWLPLGLVTIPENGGNVFITNTQPQANLPPSLFYRASWAHCP